MAALQVFFIFEFSDEDDCSLRFVQRCDDVGTHYFCLHSFLASDPCGCSKGFLDPKCGIIDANKPYEEPWPRSVCLTLIEMVDYVAFILARALCLGRAAHRQRFNSLCELLL
jgi:hypothetical protein